MTKNNKKKEDYEWSNGLKSQKNTDPKRYDGVLGPLKNNEGKPITSTWSVKPFITKPDVEKTKKKSTKLQKLRLLFRPSHYSFDGNAVIRYKEMDKIVFIMKRGTKI